MEWLSNNPIVILIAFAIVGGMLTFGKWMGSVDTDRKNFREFIVEMRNDIKEILHRLPKEYTPGSPIRLTELGVAMSDTLGGKEWAAEIATRLSAEIENKEPYEIQELSSDYVHTKMVPDETQDAKIRQCAYEHGVKREQVLNVLAIELRDILLEKAGKSPMP